MSAYAYSGKRIEKWLNDYGGHYIPLTAEIMLVFDDGKYVGWYRYA